MEQEIITQIMESIKTLNDEYGQLAQLVAVLQTDVAWLKDFFWAIFGISSATLIGTFVNVVLQRKNNKK